MNAIIYIALAISFVGFLTRHLLVSRDRFNEALRAGSPSPTNRALIANGVIFIVLAIFIALSAVRKTSDWPLMVVTAIFLGDGIWDLYHGIRLGYLCRDHQNSDIQKNEKPEQPLSPP